MNDDDRLNKLFDTDREAIFNADILDVLKNKTAKFEKAVNSNLDYKHNDDIFEKLMIVFQYFVLAYDALKFEREDDFYKYYIKIEENLYL